MVDFKKFEKIMNDIKVWSDILDEVYDKYDVSLTESPLGCCKIVDHLLNILELYMKDSFNYISWWCWETDFGRKNAEIYIRDEGKEIVFKLDTVEKLYNFIAKEYGYDK